MSGVLVVILSSSTTVDSVTLVAVLTGHEQSVVCVAVSFNLGLVVSGAKCKQLCACIMYLCMKFLQSKCIVLYIYTPGSRLIGVECTVRDGTIPER